MENAFHALLDIFQIIANVFNALLCAKCALHLLYAPLAKVVFILRIISVLKHAQITKYQMVPNVTFACKTVPNVIKKQAYAQSAHREC